MLDYEIPISVLGVNVSVIAIYITFWFWQEPKIKELNVARLDYFKEKVERYFSITKPGPIDVQKIVTFCNEMNEEDKVFIFPVAENFKPHRTIFKLLVASLIFSILPLSLVMIDGMTNQSLDEIQYIKYVKNVSFFLVFCFISIAIHNGYKVFKYIWDVMKKFSL